MLPVVSGVNYMIDGVDGYSENDAGRSGDSRKAFKETKAPAYLFRGYLGQYKNKRQQQQGCAEAGIAFFHFDRYSGWHR